MSRRSFPAACLILLILSACSPANPATTQPTSIPTHTRMPSATPRPLVAVEQTTSLYAGPGNLGFEVWAELAPGQEVDPLATYGDFALVSVTLDGRERIGYVGRQALGALPPGLPEQGSGQVPLLNLYHPEFYAQIDMLSSDQLRISNPMDGWYDIGSPAIPLNAPLRIKLQSLTGEGHDRCNLKIQGIVSSGTGEWWQGITRFDLGDAAGVYHVSIMDGRSDAGVEFDLPLASDQPIQLTFEGPEGSAVHVLNGSGEEIQFIDLAGNPDLNLPGGLFPEGVFYFGASLPPSQALNISRLQVGIIPDGSWTEEVSDYYAHPGLAELAGRHGLTMGTEFGMHSCGGARYCEIFQRDFGVAELSEFSYTEFWLGPGEYDFSDLDQAVDFPHQRGWRVRAMHLIYGNYDTIPAWLENSQYSRDEYIALLEGYIHDVVTRYADRVDEWSIANEAPNRSFNPGSDFWNDRIGPEYIAIAFRAARQADPDGILIFNENNNESPRDANNTRTVETMYATVQQLKAEGAPVDVVGMQMHLFLPWDSQVRPDKTAVIATMQRFAGLGVRIYITEFDVDLQRVPGSQAERWAYQAEIYADMMSACLESGVCDSFATWGIDDGSSWLPNFQGEPNAEALMFDVNFDPKPAYFAVRDVLLGTTP